jgi:hypothetical protein
MRSSFIPKSAVVLAAVAIAVACGSSPPKAPGSNPGDMTPEGHEAAAKKEQEEGAKHRQQAEGVQPTKPAVETSVRQGHETEAEKHQD